MLYDIPIIIFCFAARIQV